MRSRGLLETAKWIILRALPFMLLLDTTASGKARCQSAAATSAASSLSE
jgi:hypothetical protein